MTNLPTAGDHIRGYQVLGRIGSGGMGVVFSARDVKLDRTVALKFLPENLYQSEGDKRGLLQEARVISALDHPNICTIFDLVETEDGRIFMVMAYYDGGTLADRLAKGPIALPEAIDLLLGIASGISAAHSRQIVHRDIKPSNILLTRQNTPKIVDFGLAKIVSSADQTQSVETSGTVAYMAPEQLQGDAVDHRVDIWAMGVLAAELATGRHPFRKDNLAAMGYSICHDAPDISEDIPSELRQIIYKCLSKDPALRYPTCEELLHDLGAVRSHASELDAAPAASRDKRDVARRKALERSISAASGLGQARNRPRRWLAIAAVLALTLSVLALTPVRDYVLGVIYSPGEKHIAVLPFDNIGNEPGNAALVAGLMDSMTAALSNLDTDQKALWVVPASVVRSAKVTDPESALKTLGATMVVMGSVERSGNSIRVTLDLINTKTLRQIGSVSSSSDDGDLAAVQQNVLGKLGRLLHIRVTGDALPQSSGPSAPAAYDLYLEAVGYVERFDKPGNLDLAIIRLQNATSEDPGFALAYATMGEAYRLKYNADKDTKWLKPALASCEQAVKLNPQLPSTYVTLGDIHAVTGHYELAETEFQKATSLDSRNAEAVQGLAWSYEQMGRLGEAEESYRKAMVLRPGDWSGHNELALFYDRHNRYAEAVSQLQQALQLTPDNPEVYFNLGGFYLDMGDPAEYPEAERALRKSLSLAPTYPAYANLGLLYLLESRYADSIAMSERALGINDKDPLPWSYAAFAYRWLKQTAKADAAWGHVQTLAEAAVTRNAQNAESQSWLGLAYAMQGERQKAMPSLEAAIALSPAVQQVFINAIEGYYAVGSEANALRLAQQAKQAGMSLTELQFDSDLRPLLSKLNVASTASK